MAQRLVQRLQPVALLALLAAAPSPARGRQGAALPQHPVLRFRVDAESPPGQRYARALGDFLQQRGAAAFAETYSAWQQWLSGSLPERFGTPTLASGSQGAWWSALRSSRPQAVEEVLAISKLLRAVNSSEPLFEPAVVATVTSLYPILNTVAKGPSACTSTLVRRGDGGVLHGRSLDYDPRDPMALSTVALDFHREGKFEYRCLHPLVYPTALQWFTCVRPGAFSLSVNARSQGRDTEAGTSFEELLRRVAVPGAMLLGEVAEHAMQAANYEAALERLVASPAVSSNYFILAGAAGQGAVVTRFGNASSADVWALGSGAGDGQPPWLRVQTNVDHWVPLASGAYATQRRQQAVDLLSGLGQPAVDAEALMGVYMTDRARQGAQNRTAHEDTGAILRPSTIASLVMDPAEAVTPEPDRELWHVWAETPTIQPPLPGSSLVV